MEDFFKDSILTDLFNYRSQYFEHEVIQKSKEYNKQKSIIENEMKTLLKYIPIEYHKLVSKKIDDILFKMLLLGNFWNEAFYKLGISDGMNLEDEINENLKTLKNKISKENK